jgi:hypothetical protein
MFFASPFRLLVALGGSVDLFVHAKHLFLEAICDGWPWARWLQWFQRMTMRKGAGPSNQERHCTDADGDHRFIMTKAHSAATTTKRQAMMMIAGWAERRCSDVGRIVPSKWTLRPLSRSNATRRLVRLRQ